METYKKQYYDVRETGITLVEKEITRETDACYFTWQITFAYNWSTQSKIKEVKHMKRTDYQWLTDDFEKAKERYLDLLQKAINGWKLRYENTIKEIETLKKQLPRLDSEIYNYERYLEQAKSITVQDVKKYAEFIEVAKNAETE